MASSLLPIFLLAFLLFTHPSFTAHSPSPSPLPDSPAAISLPPSHPQSPSPALSILPPPESPSPSPSPSDLPPTLPSPAPSPADDNGDLNAAPAPAPTDNDSDIDDAPSPAPVTAGGLRHEDQSSAADMKAERDSGGMGGGQKAGVAIGVIAAGGVVVLGAIVYKKRQRNIRRSQYGYSAQRNNL